MKEPMFLVVDLFCGAGGTTTGFVQATLHGSTLAKVIACVNHDPYAIKSHWSNHPEVQHFEEDIRTLDLTELIKLVNYWRARYPNALLVLWASLECTNFSRAKGGKPRNADSRTLAEHLFRYIHALQPDYIQIENVVEFMSWGPLDDKGKPVSKNNGRDWLRWRQYIKDTFNYYDDWREMNSANYGAYTSRNRLFGIFAKPWLPIAFPEATHAKKPSQNGMFGDLLKWKPVREVLDFSDKGESIINRNKPLSDKTLERVYAGLVKTLASRKSEQSFITHYYGKGFNTTVSEPLPTITTKERAALIQPEFYSDTQFILNPGWGGNVGSVDAPCCVIVARQDKAPLYLVQAEKGNVACAIYSEDSAVMIRIKRLMTENNITDIKMRMLRVHEMKSIQGFPENYHLKGTLTDQKKFIGNSVVPVVVKVWTEALADLLQNSYRKAA